MNDQGKITVFLSLVMLTLMGLVLTVMTVIERQHAKARAVMAISSAVSGVQADYNPYIFERYHILLLDKDYEGAGEGKMEALAEESLEYTLSDEFTVDRVELSGTTNIMDQKCKSFREQVEKYISYGVTEYAIEQLADSVSGDDADKADEVLQEMDEGLENPDTRNHALPADVPTADAPVTDVPTADAPAADDSDGSYEDPRMKLRILSGIGIAYVIKPDSISFSENVLKPEELPSYGNIGIHGLLPVDTDFEDYDRLKQDVISCSGWTDGLFTDTALILYANDVFNCATDQIYEDTYLNCELEYLISGLSTDAENYKKAVDRILQIRLGINFSYLLTDVGKMSELSSLAWSISLVTLVPQPIVKYLLAGCWAYTEGVAEVYFMLRGDKIPYVKNRANWITDLYSLSDLSGLTNPNSKEAGMSYKDYLLLLLALQQEDSCYRMLDLIEINTRQQYDSFRMKNAVTGFAMNIGISYGDEHFDIRKETGY